MIRRLESVRKGDSLRSARISEDLALHDWNSPHRRRREHGTSLVRESLVEGRNLVVERILVGERFLVERRGLGASRAVAGWILAQGEEDERDLEGVEDRAVIAIVIECRVEDRVGDRVGH